MGKGPLLYSGPRNQRARGAGNHDEAGASHMPDSSGRKRPTDVTAVVKNQTNRATSVPAGVVSGAGCRQPVLKTPPSDESASSRTSASWPQLLQGSGSSGCVLRVVPGTIAHTKEVTGLTRLNDVAGRWSSSPPACFDGRELRSRERCQGTGSLRMRAASIGEQGNDYVKPRFFARRNRY